MNGIVTRFNDIRGFGFIKPVDGPPNEADDIFVHISQLASINGERPLAPPVGAEVTFDLCRSNRPAGQQACNVQLITRPLKSPLRFPEIDR